jgi:hypothetical protein
MKCFTVHQPWATLLALGEKRFETRTWQTRYTGPVAIHAGRTFNPDVIRLCRDQPFKDALDRHGIRSWEDLPLGSIIGVATLVACHATELVAPTAVIFTIKLKAGRLLMQSWFYDARGDELCGAYFAYVLRR